MAIRPGSSTSWRRRPLRREPCTGDPRELCAVLTDAGYEGRAASRTNLRGIDDYVIGRLSLADLASLGASRGQETHSVRDRVS